ncbi:MAG: hypothetical protein ABIH89_00905 [Elusimicrobiota bacterium]
MKADPILGMVKYFRKYLFLWVLYYFIALFCIYMNSQQDMTENPEIRKSAGKSEVLRADEAD